MDRENVVESVSPAGHLWANPRYLVLSAVIFLVSITPFGNESTDGWAIFLHRSLLCGIIALCVVSLGRRATSDLEIKAYLLVGGSLLVMFFAIWASSRATFDGFYLWYQHLLFVLFFIFLTRFNRPQTIEWKATILASLTVVIVVHCAWSLATQEAPISGPFVNTNYFGSYLLVGLASSLATATRHQRTFWRILGALSAAFLLFGITQTVSRGALVAALGITVLAMGKLDRRLWILVAIGLIILLVGFSPQIMSKFTDLGSLDSYNYLRPKIWRSTLSMVVERPLLGVGLEGYGDVASRFPVAAEGTVGRYARRHKIAHSEYLHYAAEIGIPGVLLFVSLLGYFFLAMARLRSEPRGGDSFLNEAGFLAAAGVGAHALVDNNFTVPVVAAALTLVSLTRIPLPRRSQMRFPTSLEAKTATALILAAVYLHSTLIPALAIHFNERGQRAFQAERFDDAERAHRMAVTLAPNHPLLLTNLGTMYLSQFSRTRDVHWLDAADAFFSRAVALNPDFIVARRQHHAVLTRRLNAMAFQSREMLGQLITNSREVLRVDPVSVFVRRNLAEALNSSGERDAAIRELRASIELEPNFVPVYRRLAEWYEERQDTAQSAGFRRDADRILATFAHTKDMNGYEVDLLGLGPTDQSPMIVPATP